MAAITHTVVSGDTLTDLVVAYDLAPYPSGDPPDWTPVLAVARAVAARNGITDANKITVGQQIVMATLSVVPDPGDESAGQDLSHAPPISDAALMAPASPSYTKYLIGAALVLAAYFYWKES